MCGEVRALANHMNNTTREPWTLSPLITDDIAWGKRYTWAHVCVQERDIKFPIPLYWGRALEGSQQRSLYIICVKGPRQKRQGLKKGSHLYVLNPDFPLPHTKLCALHVVLTFLMYMLLTDRSRRFHQRFSAETFKPFKAPHTGYSWRAPSVFQTLTTTSNKLLGLWVACHTCHSKSAVAKKGTPNNIKGEGESPSSRSTGALKNKGYFYTEIWSTFLYQVVEKTLGSGGVVKSLVFWFHVVGGETAYSDLTLYGKKTMCTFTDYWAQKYESSKIIIPVSMLHISITFL